MYKKKDDIKIEFIDLEFNKFNLIENESIRNSCMSIYGYLLYLLEVRNLEYKKAGIPLPIEADKFKISFNKLLDAYNKKHDKTTLTTLKNRVTLLDQYGLISIDRSKKINTYSFFRFELTSKVSNEPTNKKPLEAIENTSVEANNYFPISLNSELNNKDIDTGNTSADSVPYEEFIQSQDKCTSWDNISETLVATFKNFKLRSSRLKAEVIRRIENNLTNISKRFATNYIDKVVLQVKLQEQNRRVAYKKSILSNWSNINNEFASNCMSRNYNFDLLEKALSGEGVPLHECTI